MIYQALCNVIKFRWNKHKRFRYQHFKSMSNDILLTTCKGSDIHVYTMYSSCTLYTYFRGPRTCNYFVRNCPDKTMKHSWKCQTNLTSYFTLLFELNQHYIIFMMFLQMNTRAIKRYFDVHWPSTCHVIFIYELFVMTVKHPLSLPN